jgi:glycosyltransferase involved in cell wall biosynthesis
LIFSDEKIISIICPIYNESNYITSCINALLHQTISKDRIEILIIDGFSNDGTRQIVENIAKENESVKLLDNPERIVTRALNIGFEMAKGEIIIRVDGHAVVSNDFIQNSIECLEKTNADCVGGIIECVNTSKKGIAIALAMSSKFGVGNSRFRTSGKEGYVDTVAFGAYKKEVLKKLGLIDPDLIGADDDEFNYRLRESGGKIYLCPKIKSKYYTRSNYTALFNQFFSYGFWKVRVLQKHFRMMQPRQFIPPLFVLSIIFTGIAGLFNPYLLSSFCSILSLYFLLSLLMSLYLAVRENQQVNLIHRLFIAFPVLHLSYGIGFLWGNIKFFRKWF